jgi:predicted GNAT superfamily acetyltransferase
MAPDIVVRQCEKLEEFHRCVEIERDIWGESDLETEPYVTFVVAAQTGGQVLGAFDGDTMVGFTLGLAAFRDNTPYIHSHMTGVLSSHRDRRVGRLLKLYQRDEALHRGIRHVEWTFDPLETRNAHFNFNRLGAIARTFKPNFYGVTSSPLHRSLPTDRLLVDWQLDTKRVRDPQESPATIHLPAELERWKQDEAEREHLEAEQLRIRDEFLHWFAKGYAVTGIRFTLTGADYCLAPWSDF